MYSVRRIAVVVCLGIGSVLGYVSTGTPQSTCSLKVGCRMLDRWAVRYNSSQWNGYSFWSMDQQGNAGAPASQASVNYWTTDYVSGDLENCPGGQNCSVSLGYNIGYYYFTNIQPGGCTPPTTMNVGNNAFWNGVTQIPAGMQFQNLAAARCNTGGF